MKMRAYWNMAPCRLVEVGRRFRSKLRTTSRRHIPGCCRRQKRNDRELQAMTMRFTQCAYLPNGSRILRCDVHLLPHAFVGRNH
jgi:hypothetical protein